MINENLTKSDLRKIKSMIKKELKKFKKKEVEKKVKDIIKSEFNNVEKIDKDFDSKVEDITKQVIQSFHDLLYREKYILKKKVKR
tara:strand:+ start:2631 stop:2885 length:255 start_codon:yes stop_codon:yes gene_type:complete